MRNLLISTQVLADNGGRGDMDGWGHMGSWGGGWMWLWGSLMVLFWVAVIAGAVWFVTRGRDHASGKKANQARDILDERYARGELTTDDSTAVARRYDRMARFYEAFEARRLDDQPARR